MQDATLTLVYGGKQSGTKRDWEIKFFPDLPFKIPTEEVERRGLGKVANIGIVGFTAFLKHIHEVQRR